MKGNVRPQLLPDLMPWADDTFVLVDPLPPIQFGAFTHSVEMVPIGNGGPTPARGALGPLCTGEQTCGLAAA